MDRVWIFFAGMLATLMVQAGGMIIGVAWIGCKVGLKEKDEDDDECAS